MVNDSDDWDGVSDCYLLPCISIYIGTFLIGSSFRFV